MTDDALQVEIWKKTVEVQQHFNTIEMQIRNFLLAIVGAFLALGGYAIKDGGDVIIWDFRIAVAGLVVLGALVPLVAFYLMDRFWYHRLLNGAVTAGAKQEVALEAKGYIVSLGSMISAESSVRLLWTKYKMRSNNKIDGFYGLLALSIVLIACALAVTTKTVTPSPPKLPATPSASPAPPPGAGSPAHPD